VTLSIALESSPLIENKLEKEEEKQTKNRLLGYDKNKDSSKTKMILQKEEAKDFRDKIENWSLEELTMLMEYEEEYNRKGFYELIFPKPSNIKTYEKFFECPRHNNMLLWSYLRYGKNISLGKYYKKLAKE
jgi:hypothetical protein